ncbi:MAG: glycosyltransferase family 39 protein, partial [Novosphingobium sp.]|nr:glycosyltransferase family 39 protein [Novosphingobium sp.]
MPVSKLVEFYEAATRDHVRTVAFLVVLSLGCFLSGFFSLPPIDRDEARFVQATKQMVESGDYIDIRIQDEVRYKKPAGIYWLQAAAVQASGQGAQAPIWVYRLPSLIAAVSIVLLTYWTALALVSRPAAALAATMLAAVLLLGVEARLAKTDAVLCATIVAAMGVLARLVMARGEKLPHWQVAVFWASAALGILVKGPIWLMVVGLAIAAVSLLERSCSWIFRLRPLIGLICVLAAVVPWFVAIMIVSDGAFLKLSLGQDMLGKVASGQESHGAPPGTYLGAFLITSWPMVAPVLLSLGWIWRRRTALEVRFLLCWIVPSWIVFELVATKLPHYV